MPLSRPIVTAWQPAAAATNFELIADLKRIVGASHVLTNPSSTRRFRKGFRFREGPALAVVRPDSLIEQWRVLNACVAAGKIVLMQAANTGITGGSTPDGDTYDRDIVIISTMRMDRIHVIRDGAQVVCLPGAMLFKLEKTLEPLGRNPHSVIGSSCIGSSVFGGVCNNSGGALIHRGPAFTQMTLYAQVTAEGRIELINHLGIRLGDDPRRSSPGSRRATLPRPRSRTIRTVSARITAIRSMCAISRRRRRRASTPRIMS